MSISELKVRLQGVVDRLSQLVERVTEKTELGVFLIAICRVSCVGVFHGMAPMARTVAKLVEKSLTGNDLKIKRSRFEWDTVKDPDPTLCIYQTRLVKNIGPYLEFHLKYAYGTLQTRWTSVERQLYFSNYYFFLSF